MRVCVFIILLITSSGVQAQQLFDSIEISSVSIKNFSNRAIGFLASRTEIENKFGKALVTQGECEPGDCKVSYDYQYDGLVAYFGDEKLAGVDITGKQYTLVLQGKGIKVGDNIRRLNLQYPVSYKNREMRTKAGGLFRLFVIEEGMYLDADIVITYNEQDILTSINVQFICPNP